MESNPKKKLVEIKLPEEYWARVLAILQCSYELTTSEGCAEMRTQIFVIRNEIARQFVAERS